MHQRSRTGFTLVELVVTLVILSVLTGIALPAFIDLRTEAQASAEAYVTGSIRSALQTYFIDPAQGNRQSYPATLDDWPNGTICAKSACGNPAESCFNHVLVQGGLRDANWTKLTPTTYQGPTGTVYTYSSLTGEFSS